MEEMDRDMHLTAKALVFHALKASGVEIWDAVGIGMHTFISVIYIMSRRNLISHASQIQPF